MNFKLKTGETWMNSEGYEHGDFVAYLGKIRMEDAEKRMSFRINIYKSQVDKDAGRGVDEVKSYDIDDTQYDQALLLIKNRAINHDENMMEAIYSLLLTRPFWENWEIV